MSTVLLKNGYTTTDPRLDRIPQFDPASRNYKIRDSIDEVEDQLRRALTPKTQVWPPNRGLNQQKLGGCVGWSGTHRGGADPVRRDEILTEEYAREFYFECQRRDPWEGGEYPGAEPQYAGTSVLAGCQVAKDLGLIDSYRWMGAGSGRVIDDTVISLGHFGPIIFGVPWYDSMFDPRPSGLLEVSGSVAGGHAIMGFAVWLGARLPGEPGSLDLIVLQQSWGPWGIAAYGQPTGICFIRVEDMERLMEEEGEGVLWNEVTTAPVVRTCPSCGQRLP